MSVVQPLSADSENVIRIFDSLFDLGADYSLKFTESFTCREIVIDADDVSFCKDIAKIKFILPCVESGDYKVKVIDKADDSVKYEIMSKIY